MVKKKKSKKKIKKYSHKLHTWKESPGRRCCFYRDAVCYGNGFGFENEKLTAASVFCTQDILSHREEGGVEWGRKQKADSEYK